MCFFSDADPLYILLGHKICCFLNKFTLSNKSECVEKKCILGVSLKRAISVFQGPLYEPVLYLSESLKQYM